MPILALARASSRDHRHDRRSSSATSVRVAPGRVDSPPTSTDVGPLVEQRQPVPDRVGRIEPLPAVGEESGVTLTTPDHQRAARLREIAYRRHRLHLSHPTAERVIPDLPLDPSASSPMLERVPYPTWDRRYYPGPAAANQRAIDCGTVDVGMSTSRWFLIAGCLALR